MLDIAWPELVVIGAVALVAIGPKDLPKVMHTLGKWAGKARSFAHEMHRAFDQLSYESEIAENLKNEKRDSEEQSTKKDRDDSPPLAGGIGGGVQKE